MMIKKYSDQSITGIITNLYYGINSDSGESKKTNESKKTLLNNKFTDNTFSDSEQNAMIEMYAEIISILVNQHFE